MRLALLGLITAALAAEPARANDVPNDFAHSRSGETQDHHISREAGRSKAYHPDHYVIAGADPRRDCYTIAY